MLKILPIILALSLPLAACQGEPQAEAEPTPTPTPTVAAEPEPDYYQQGLEKGMEAAVAAGTAQTWTEWDGVFKLWAEARTKLRKVPEASANYANAQAKLEEYDANLQAAYTRREQQEAPAAARPSAPAPKDAMDIFGEKIAAADPDKTVIARFEPTDQPGAIVVVLTDPWELMPEPTRENSAHDLWTIWADAWMQESGERNAMIILESTRGKILGRVTRAGVKLKD